MMSCDSVAINKVAAQLGGTAEFVGVVGEGDERLTLWSLPNGSRVLETNGDPFFEDENPVEFAEAIQPFGEI